MTQPAAAASPFGAWEPEEHPRDSKGRFREKTSLAPNLVAKISQTLKRFKPARFRSQQHAQSFLATMVKGQKKRSPKQQDAVERFFSEGFADIQVQAREGRAAKPSPDVAALDSAMQPLPYDMILTRQMSGRSFGMPDQLDESFEDWTNQLVADEGYFAGNLGEPQQTPGPHITMSIVTPAGTRAVARGDGSPEVALARDTPLRITKVEPNGAGGYYVYAVVRPQGEGAPHALNRNDKKDLLPQDTQDDGITPSVDEGERGVPEPGDPNQQNAPGAAPDGGVPGAAPDPNAPEDGDRTPLLDEGNADAPNADAPDADGEKAPEVAAREEKVSARERDLNEREAEINRLRSEALDAREKDVAAREGGDAGGAVPAKVAPPVKKAGARAAKKAAGAAPPRQRADANAEAPAAKKAAPAAKAAPRKAPARKAAPAKKAAPAAGGGGGGRDLNQMLVKDLRAMAAERGVKVPARAKKSDIVQLLGGQVPGSARDVDGVDMNRMLVRDLRQRAAERGIKIPAGARKADIVKLLGDNPPPAKKAAPEAPKVDWPALPKREPGARLRDSADGAAQRQRDNDAPAAPEGGGRHRRPDTAKPSTSQERLLEERRAQRAAARAERQHVARAQAIASVLAQLDALEDIDAPADVRERHVRGVALGPLMEEIRSTNIRGELKDQLERVAKAIGRDDLEGHIEVADILRPLMDDLGNGDRLEMVGLDRFGDRRVPFDPDIHDVAPGAETPAVGEMIHVMRPGVAMVRANGQRVELERSMVRRLVDAQGRLDVPSRREVHPSRAPRPDGLDQMKLPELRKLAASMGIPGRAKARKSELIAMIRANQEPRPLSQGTRRQEVLRRLEALDKQQLDDIARREGMFAFPDGIRREILVDMIADVAQARNDFIVPPRRDDILHEEELKKWSTAELIDNWRRRGHFIPIEQMDDNPRPWLIRQLRGERVEFEPSAVAAFDEGEWADVSNTDLIREINAAGLHYDFWDARENLIDKLRDIGWKNPNGPIDDMPERQLREIAEDARVVLPSTSPSREELLSAIRNKPQIDFHVDLDQDPRVRKLVGDVAAGIESQETLGGGAMGDTRKVTFKNKVAAVRKRLRRAFGVSSTQQGDAEQLAAELARAVGAPAPAVYRQANNELYMDFVAGKPAHKMSLQKQGEAVLSPEGTRIGLLDALVGNGDRHELNWMIDSAGKPIAIDHGLAWDEKKWGAKEMGPEDLLDEHGEIKPGPMRGAFVEAFVQKMGFGDESKKWREEIPFSRSELAEIRERIVALRPQFLHLGRQKWYETTLLRLDAIMKRAMLP